MPRRNLMKGRFCHGWSTASSLVLILVVTLLAGCARQPNVQAQDESATAQSGDEHKLPFEHEPEKNGVSPTGSLVPMPASLPAGHPLTIRLQSAVSSASARSGDSFDGVV